MRFITVVFCFSLSTKAFALVEQEYAQRLSRSRSAAHIAQLKREFETLKVTRTACRLQLNQKQLPLACYEALAAEIRWGLHPGHETRRHLVLRLDELCRQAAHALNLAKNPVLPPDISAACRKEVAQAQLIQKYREGRTAWSEN